MDSGGRSRSLHPSGSSTTSFSIGDSSKSGSTNNDKKPLSSTAINNCFINVSNVEGSFIMGGKPNVVHVHYHVHTNPGSKGDSSSWKQQGSSSMARSQTLPANLGNG